MPNHTYNVIYNVNDFKRLKKLAVRKDKDGELIFDFEKIIPMPKDLHIESRYAARIKGKDLTTVKTLLKKYKDPAMFAEMGHALFGLKYDYTDYMYIRNIQYYGYSDWYHWSLAKWGTKWNSYDCEVGEDIICFNTAWSRPDEIFEALVKMGFTFTTDWNDEGDDDNILTKRWE